MEEVRACALRMFQPCIVCMLFTCSLRNIIAYASFIVGTEGQGAIYTCAPYWTLPPYPTTCSGYGRADVLVHELSHFYDTDVSRLHNCSSSTPLLISVPSLGYRLWV
jgi:hypothetical protein